MAINHPCKFRTADNFLLSGDWFLPEVNLAKPAMVVVFATGGGLPARLYERFVRGLADRGLAVLAFDYRGIGRSRPSRLKGFYAGIETWAGLDFGAALRLASTTYPDLPIGVVTHSVGALLVGAAEGAVAISRMVFLGPHTGFWGDYRLLWRAPLFLTWHVFMPIVTKFVGYFPGRALRLGEDLPLQFATDWARHRRRSFLRSEVDHRRFAEILMRYGDIRAKTLIISISDDAFAPPPAAKALLKMYPNISATLEAVRPKMLGSRRLGHLGFIRRPYLDHFLRRTAAWLLQDSTEATPWARRDASRTEETAGREEPRR